MKKLSGIILAMAGLGMFLAGCNSSGVETLGPVNDASLVGKWRIENFAEKGTYEIKMTAPVAHDTIVKIDTSKSYADSTYYIEFKSDKTFTSSQPSALTAKVSAAAAVTTGTWSLSGSTLTTLTQSGTKTDTLTMDVGIIGSVLTAVDHIQTTQSYGTATYTTDITATYTAAKM